MAQLIRDAMQRALASTKTPGAETYNDAADVQTAVPVANTAPPTEEPTPAEQASYDKVVLAGLKVLYSEQTHAGIVQMLERGKDSPAKALADVAATLILQLDRKSGGKIPEMVILPAAAELLEEAGQLAAAAKIFPVDEAVLSEAMQRMIVDLAEQYGVEPQDVKALMDSVPKEELMNIARQQGRPGQPSQTTTPPVPAAQEG